MGSVPNIKEAREIANRQYSGEARKINKPSKKRQRMPSGDPFEVKELPLQFLTDA